jgi:hypothetical protein
MIHRLPDGSDMGGAMYPGMGAVLARTWSDPGFGDRLLDDPAVCLREVGIDVPATVTVVAREACRDQIHLALGAPPIVVPSSPLSDLRDFACTYRHPALWSLNWLGRDPVASRRFLDDPAAALERLGVAVPDGLAIRAFVNTADTMHLILPPRLPAERCTPALLANVAAGRVQASLRFGRLFGTRAYDLLIALLSRPTAATATP